jgi:predicted DNA-binding transcriptional regulator AlpA
MHGSTDKKKKVGKPADKTTAKKKVVLRFISKKEMLERVGVSYQKIWRLMQAGEFPRSRKVGTKSVWLEHEVDEWIDRQPMVKLKGDFPEPTR